MISLISTNRDSYGVKEYVIDTVADLQDLPTNIAMGSTAFCIATSTLYMLNGYKQWKEI